MINSFLQLIKSNVIVVKLDDDAKEFIGFAVNGAKRLDKISHCELIQDPNGNNNTKEMMFSQVDFEKVIEQIKFK